MENIAVLILAAGKSSRMNSIKQLAKINQKTLLDITLEKVKNVFSDNIYCILGANFSTIKEGIATKDVHFINNKNFEKGLSSSIVSGIEYFEENRLNFESVFILLADQPAIDISYLQAMVSLYEENKHKIIASKYGKIFGVPAIFPSTYFSELLSIKEDKGAKQFINQRKDVVIYSKYLTNLFDIDTKEDLNNYIKSTIKNSSKT